MTCNGPELFQQCDESAECEICDEYFKELPRTKLTVKHSMIHGDGLYLKVANSDGPNEPFQVPVSVVNWQSETDTKETMMLYPGPGITKGTIIAHVNGTRRSKPNAFTVKVGKVLIEPDNQVKFLNHSCRPNCKLQKWVDGKGKERVSIVAAQDFYSDRVFLGGADDIELTVDYNDSGRLAQEACNCASCESLVGFPVCLDKVDVFETADDAIYELQSTLMDSTEPVSIIEDCMQYHRYISKNRPVLREVHFFHVRVKFDDGKGREAESWFYFHNAGTVCPGATPLMCGVYDECGEHIERWINRSSCADLIPRKRNDNV